MKDYLLFSCSILSLIFRGFVLSNMWMWFIYESLTYVSLGVTQAIGICMLSNLFTKQYIKQDINGWEVIGFDVAGSVIVLFTGYIVHLFM